MKTKLLLTALPLLLIGSLTAQSDEEAAIRELIREAYVNGAYNKGIPRNMELGFSKDFESIGLVNGRNEILSIEEWIAQVKQQKAEGKFPLPREERISVHYHRIDINRTHAHVKLNRMVGGKPVAVEYLDLYKYPEGWMLVNKTYQELHSP